jgi:hypothetical protein
MEMDFKQLGKKLPLFFILLILLSIGCKTSKKVVNLPIKQRSQADIVNALKSRYIPFSFLSIKASAEFEALGMGGSGSMNLRIKRDSLIWMQGKKLGIEGFRGIINKDSFTMVNRLEGSYYREPNDAISSMFGVSFNYDEIQELMAGNILPFNEDAISHYQQIEDKCIVVINSARYNISYVVDARNLLLKEIDLKDRQGNSAKAFFDDYRPILKTKLTTPYIRNYYFLSRSGDEGKMEINISELELNIEKTLIFDLPLRYDRLRL